MTTNATVFGSATPTTFFRGSNATVFAATPNPTVSDSSSSSTFVSPTNITAPQFVATPSSVFVSSFATAPSTLISATLSTTSQVEASPSTSEAHSGGLSTTAVAGLSLGLGLLVGLVGSTLIYLYRRRRAAKNGRSAQPLEWSGRPGDGEALLGYQEKQVRLDNPVPQPVAVPPAHARIMDWVQRTRATSMSTLASSYFPVISSEPTVSRSHSKASTSTLMRSPSMASSRSVYSQASALPSRVSDEDRDFEGGPSRPPYLERISE